MFNVSVLLPYDALLKCVVAEVVLFSVVAYKTDISQGSVATHLRCGRIFSKSIIKIFSWFCQWKGFENWSIFDEVIRRTEIVPIFGPPCMKAIRPMIHVNQSVSFDKLQSLVCARCMLIVSFFLFIYSFIHSLFTLLLLFINWFVYLFMFCIMLMLPCFRGEIGQPGQPGGQGFTGMTGDPGLPGSRGFFGPPGQQGFTGEAGFTGPQGSVGQLGQPGAPGPTGFTGLIITTQILHFVKLYFFILFICVFCVVAHLIVYLFICFLFNSFCIQTQLKSVMLVSVCVCM